MEDLLSLPRRQNAQLDQLCTVRTHIQTTHLPSLLGHYLVYGLSPYYKEKSFYEIGQGVHKLAVNATTSQGGPSSFQGLATDREKDEDSWTVALLGRQVFLTMNIGITLKKAIAETMA